MGALICTKCLHVESKCIAEMASNEGHLRAGHACLDGFDGGNPPGLVKVLSKGNYVAVVAKTEWQAIQAAQALKLTWKKPATPAFPNGYDALYEYL